jgi:hypothetical protein
LGTTDRRKALQAPVRVTRVSLLPSKICGAVSLTPANAILPKALQTQFREFGSENIPSPNMARTVGLVSRFRLPQLADAVEKGLDLGFEP